MRSYFLCAAGMAAAVISGANALAQVPAAGSSPQVSQADGLTDNVPVPSPPDPFWRFDFNRHWAVPRGLTPRDGLDKEGLGVEQDRNAGSIGQPAPSVPGREEEQKSGAAEAEKLKKALASKPTPEAMRSQRLDILFEDLRKARSPNDAEHIAASIEQLWLHSHSDTANLLMQRATASVLAGQFPLALSLLDKLVALEPDWAEAWNQRATTRFLTGDTDGAMADIDHVIKLEPRHFGALAGMGMILEGAGLDKSALTVFNRVLAIYPLEPDIQKMADKLTLEVEGQDI
jgi:tetratricopeptide (TPR) repeat protein